MRSVRGEGCWGRAKGEGGRGSRRVEERIRRAEWTHFGQITDEEALELELCLVGGAQEEADVRVLGELCCMGWDPTVRLGFGPLRSRLETEGGEMADSGAHGSAVRVREDVAVLRLSCAADHASCLPQKYVAPVQSLGERSGLECPRNNTYSCAPRPYARRAEQ